MRFSFVALSSLTLLVTPALAGPAPAPASTSFDWQLDPSHSRVGFVVKHLAVTNVRGEFRDFAAPILKANADGKIDALEAAAQTRSINTGNDKRDEHLRGDDFFNAEKFPQLKLKVKALSWQGDKFTADVDVTIRDKTKLVKFEGEKSPVSRVNFGAGPQTQVGYSASAKISRKEFGINGSKAIEAVPVVSDDVKLELEIEMSRKTNQ
jgi:polyisoprenoid-binding protein YceI